MSIEKKRRRNDLAPNSACQGLGPRKVLHQELTDVSQQIARSVRQRINEEIGRDQCLAMHGVLFFPNIGRWSIGRHRRTLAFRRSTGRAVHLHRQNNTELHLYKLFKSGHSFGFSRSTSSCSLSDFSVVTTYHHERLNTCSLASETPFWCVCEWMGLCLGTYLWLSLCLCVCACVWEREWEGELETPRPRRGGGNEKDKNGEREGRSMTKEHDARSYEGRWKKNDGKRRKTRKDETLPRGERAHRAAKQATCKN